MVLPADQRHRMIRHAVLRGPERSIELWRTLALHLTSIIGDGGFESLYARSLHQASIRDPWLASPVTGPHDAIFSDLFMRMQERGMPESGQACIALLTIFIDTLILLIGEPVMTNILRAAWG